MKNLLKIYFLVSVTINCLGAQKLDSVYSLKSKNNEFIVNQLGNSSFVKNKQNKLLNSPENSNPNFRKLHDDHEYVWTSYNLKNLKNTLNTNLKNNIDNNLKEKIRNYHFTIALTLLLDKNGIIKEIQFHMDIKNNFTGDDFEIIEKIIKKIKVPVIPNASKWNSYYSTINYVSITGFIVSKEF
jgi:hypothetical protein